MFCCHQHLQQRDQSENTKIYRYIYVNILFALTKAIAIMFERVTTYYQTLKTWIGQMQRITISSTPYHTRYHNRYRTFSLSLT